MISEVLMAPGSFSIPLTVEAHNVWDTVKKVTESGGGHIVITPQWVEPWVLGDASMLAAARYTGPVLEKDYENGAFVIKGQGMGWWLGDDEKGDVYETAVTLTSAALNGTNLGLLLPDAITAGTVTAAYSNFTGTFHYDIPRDAIATFLAALESEYRINPDGTMDAGLIDNLFTITTPTVVVSRHVSGSDPNYIGVPLATLKSSEDARSYATRAVLIDVASDGTKTLNTAASQSPSPTGKDIHGNTIVRTLVYESQPGDPGTPVDYLQAELNEHIDIEESTITTGYWELAQGTWGVGDAFYVWDPPAFYDTDNQIRYRGELIYPKKLRLIAASWPLVRGMGVSFRDDSGAYTDLTEWVKWEAQDQTTALGQQGSGLTPNIPGASTLVVRNYIVPSEPF